MDLSKKAQLAYKYKRKSVAVTLKEEAIQKQANDYLDIKKIRYIRIPDGVWGYLAYKASEGIKIWFRKIFGGIPDNICMIRINEKYNLCLALELKTKTGKLHGKQKHWYKDLAVQISRSPEDTMQIIDGFEKEAERMKGVLSGEDVR